MLAPVSAWLDADFPSLEVTVIEAGDSGQALDMVHGGRADLSIVFDIVGPGHRAGRYRRAGVRSTFLFAEEIVALTAVEVDVSGDRVDPHVLADQRWIVGPGTCSEAVATSIAREPAASDTMVTLTGSAVALATRAHGTAFLAESAVQGFDLPAGVRTLALEPFQLPAAPPL